MTKKSMITHWFGKAQIDYRSYYMSLYASFNAWYRGVTGKQNDREALNMLRAGNVIWLDFCAGVVLRDLTAYMVMVAELTQREPLSSTTPHWQGVVSSSKDWPSLVEYWYRVRCLVMHGAEIEAPYVYLAYETLNRFMTETIRRDASENCLQTSVISV